MMYDEDLLEAIRDTMPRQRPQGFGITANELSAADDSIETDRQARYYLDKQVRKGKLQKERMTDYDGIKRLVYYKGE